MAKTARPRTSSFFDASTMKRLTGFFGTSSSDHKEREGLQTTSLPPLVTNISHQRDDSEQKTTEEIPTEKTPTVEAPASSEQSIPTPPSTSTTPPRPQSLTPPMDGTISRAPPLTPPHPHPQSSSTVASARTSFRNFSGASAMSTMSGASYTSHSSSRPDSPLSNVPVPPSPTVTGASKSRKRRSIFGRKRKDDVEIPAAWRLANASSENLDGYNFGPLIEGKRAPDMWNPHGDTLVFLAPRNTADSRFTTPSFRIASSPLLFSALGQYIEDLQFPGQHQRRPGSPLANNDGYLEVPTSGSPVPAATEFSSTVTRQQGESPEDGNVSFKLYYPALELNPKATVPTKGRKHKHTSSSAGDDSFQQLMDARNLFAFLTYTFLVSTLRRETSFQILEKVFRQLQGPISPQLHPEDRSPLDMAVSRRISTAEGHFLYFVNELKLDDIRNDDDAIIEALIMGERWKCQRLYREGFVHACGRWEEIKDHPGCVYVSHVTKSRLDRASIDLHQIRLQNVGTRLTNFDFPSVWVGDGRYAECKPWKAGFDAMRKFTLSYYKHVYGAWPPKAGKHGKGGGFTETGGLNRMVLRRLYEDFCAVYDLLVDREWIHGDRIRFEANYLSEGEDGEEQKSKEEHARTTMRKIMSDFNQSYMPVQPDIPFDQPRLPYIPTTPPSTAEGQKKQKKSRKPRSQRKLKSDDLTVVLKNSYNSDALNLENPNGFAVAYEKLEHDFGSGKTLEDVIEARRGRWVFIYCILQSLPMTVVDAVGCQYTDGVEYFLCENVKGSLPWERSQSARASRLSGIWGVTGQSPYGGLGAAGVSTGNLVGDDEVDYTYRRSHCWDVAEDWRMIRGGTIPEESTFDLEEESGSEGFIEYTPLDNPLPDSPIETSLGNQDGPGSVPPRSQSHPTGGRGRTQSPSSSRGERNQTQSPGARGYAAYHQQGLPRSQSEESNRTDPRHDGYQPGTYHPGTYPESDRPTSYQSQQSQNLPPFEFQLQQTEDAMRGPPVLDKIVIATDGTSESLHEQLERAFSPTSPSSPTNSGRVSREGK